MKRRKEIGTLLESSTIRGKSILFKLRFIPLLMAGATFCVVAVCVIGCRKGESGSAGQAVQTPEQAAADPFNLAGVRAAFAKASPGLQVIIDEALGSVRAGDYAGAVRQFEAISQRKDLTQEQRKALEELIAKLRAAGPGGLRR